MDIVLFSSPHKNGATAALLEKYAEKSSETVIYDLYEHSPQPCIDCGVCALRDGCSLHDIDRLMADFESADRIIFAFPVYNLSFPAPMKALFDRFQRYYNARFKRNKKPPVEKRRQAVLIITCGREWQANEETVMKQIRQSFSILNLEITDVFVEDCTDCAERGDKNGKQG
ncbi:MAG: flavodoxin family protein [Clostridia bacterium]|nr:flavodoxin family protein [Clostridia bacterium]